MELLDRYLEAVRKHLPWRGQDDILAELKANLESQLEEKESELGRRLTNEEAEEWLKQLGPPIQMAARYQRQQYLIGPAVFPVYWYILRLTLAWCAAIYIIVGAVEIAAQGLDFGAAMGAVLHLPWVLLIDGAIVTLVFALIEQFGVRHGGKCDILFAGPAWTEMRLPFEPGPDAKKKKRSYASAVAEVIFGFIFFAWLLLIPHYPFLLLGAVASYLTRLPYKLAPVWWLFYWSLVALNGFQLTWKTVDFARGIWQGPHRARHIAMRLLGLIPIGLLLFAPRQALFLPKNHAANAVTHAAQLASANRGIHIAFAIAFVILALQLVWAAGKMVTEGWRVQRAAL